MKKIPHVTLAAAALALLGHTGAQAGVVSGPTLVKNSNGTIASISNLLANGNLYDITVSEGSCGSVFGNAACMSGATGFGVSTQAEAFGVMQAIEDFAAPTYSANTASSLLSQMFDRGLVYMPYAMPDWYMEVAQFTTYTGAPFVTGAGVTTTPDLGIQTSWVNPSFFYNLISVTEIGPADNDVPEPTTAALSLAALAAAVAATRRRKAPRA